jgi:DNA-binding transcriptional MerR regulator
VTAWAWAAVCLSGMFVAAALGDLVSEEIRGWLDLAPRAMLRLAALQLENRQRDTIYRDEWLPELIYVLRGAESRPITRLIRGTTFALGLLIAARRIAHYRSPARRKAHLRAVSHNRGVATQHAGEQGLLFGDEILAVQYDDVGYRGPTACAAAGITYRQLDYWARTRLVEPSVRTARGPGSQRLYSFRDICMLKVIKRLLDTGISLQQIRTAVERMRGRHADDLARLTFMSDGKSVHECTSVDEVVDLLAGGQGVFGIAFGRIWREVDGTLAELPAERAEGWPRE